MEYFMKGKFVLIFLFVGIFLCGICQAIGVEVMSEFVFNIFNFMGVVIDKSYLSLNLDKYFNYRFLIYLVKLKNEIKSYYIKDEI